MQIQRCIERLELAATEFEIAKSDALGFRLKLYLWVFGIAYHLDIGCQSPESLGMPEIEVGYVQRGTEIPLLFGAA